MNFLSRLNGAISDTDTIITINGASGLHATAGGYYLLLDDETSVQELIYVISRSAYTLLVTRGQGGTTAVSWADNVLIRNYDRDMVIAGTGIAIEADVATDTIKISATSGSGLTQPEVLARISMRV